MWLKLCGSVLIVASGTALGFSIAARYRERPRQIQKLISCIVALKAHINYAVLPLAEALVNCASGIEGPVAELFHRMSKVLAEKGWLTPLEAMTEALRQLDGKLAFEQPELEVLTVLGANLGSMDRAEQQRYLTLVQEQLQQLLLQAAAKRDQNTKMYQYLGICGSLAVVILLV